MCMPDCIHCYQWELGKTPQKRNLQIHLKTFSNPLLVPSPILFLADIHGLLVQGGYA